MSPQNTYSKKMKPGRDGQQARNTQRLAILSKKSLTPLPFGRLAVVDTAIPGDQGVKLPVLATDITNVGNVMGIVMATQFLESEVNQDGPPPEYTLFPANIMLQGPAYVHVETAVKPTDSVYVRFAVNNNPANAIQTINPTGGVPTAGTFKLSFRGVSTPVMPRNANAATILAALQAMMNNPALDLGAAAVTSVVGDLITGGGPSFAVTFGGILANQSVENLVAASNLTYNGGASVTGLAINTTTSGHGVGGYLGIFTNVNDGNTCALVPNASYLTSGNPENDAIVEIELTRA